MTTEASTRQRDIDWSEQLEVALTLPGSLGSTYSRFHQYSFLNCVRLWGQGVEPQPVATFKRWRDLGRHVVKGAKAKEIIRPIMVKHPTELDDDGEPRLITRFKPVRCIFPLCDTAGEDLPPADPPTWSKERALEALGIRIVPFQEFDGNVQGWSEGKNLAINPVAVNPTKTLMHECGHIVLGHTVESEIQEYQQHRGTAEFQAEGTAYLCMNELELLDETTASTSRAYIADWLRGERPSDVAIRGVFKATDTILRAGRVELEADA